MCDFLIHTVFFFCHLKTYSCILIAFLPRPGVVNFESFNHFSRCVIVSCDLNLYFLNDSRY